MEGIQENGSLDPALWESTHENASYRKVPEESLIISGDENVVDVNMIVQYHISDPLRYLFNVREPDRAIKDAVEASLRQVIGNYTIDDALTGGRMSIQNDIQSTAQETLDSYDSGLEITVVQLQDVHPPAEVADAFKDVASAREDKDKTINDANAYQGDILPKARGSAEKTILDAEGYKAEKVNMAKGDVDKFMKLYTEYTNNKNITKTRLYLETMESVLPNVKLYIIDPSANTGKSVDYSTLMMFKELTAQNQQRSGGNMTTDQALVLRNLEEELSKYD